MYERFFAFGCSFTNHIWPTWANIIAKDLDIDFFNYGISGLGNVGIASRVLEADIKHKFNENDLILILWSNWTREDVYDDGRWLAGGNIFNNSYFDLHYLKKYWNVSNSIVKNSSAIISTNKILKNKIAFQGHMNPVGKAETPSKIYQNLNSNEQRCWDFYIANIPCKENYFMESDLYQEYENLSDKHPTVLSHLNYVEQKIYKKLDLKLKNSTKEYFTSIDKKISSLQNKNFYKKLNLIWKQTNEF